MEMLNTDTLFETPPGRNSEKIERSMFDVHFSVNPSSLKN